MNQPGTLLIEFDVKGKPYQLGFDCPSGPVESVDAEISDSFGSIIYSDLRLKNGPSFWDTHDWEDFAKQSPESEGTGEAAKPSPEDAQSPTP